MHINFLKRAHAIDDVKRVRDAKKITPGKGKYRNRRYKQNLGPLIIFKNNKGLVNAFRNIPGVDTASVDRLNLLQLAPGGHVGRFVIWTEDAFKDLNSRFGTYEKGDSIFHLRNGASYKLPRPMMLNTDVDRIIQSDEIQNALPPRTYKSKRVVRKKNPLTNLYFMVKLNPHALSVRRNAILSNRKHQVFKQKKVELKKQKKWVDKGKTKKVKDFLKFTEKTKKINFTKLFQKCFIRSKTR